MTQLDDIIIIEATSENAESISNFFSTHKEVSFCRWQNELQTKSVIEDASSIILIAKKGDTIIGAICGGLLGTRATVNHIAIDSNYRKIGIGKRLFSNYQNLILERGIQRVFLFVDEENKKGNIFWENIGFKPTVNEITLEKDLL